MANGFRLRNYGTAGGGKSSQLMTSNEIQTGPPPSRIPRDMDANNRGIVDDGNIDFFYLGSDFRMPSRGIPRNIAVPNRQGIPGIDMTSDIPSPSAGAIFASSGTTIGRGAF